MPKRRGDWPTGWRGTAGRPQFRRVMQGARRGRFANGRYRKVGYWGRYPGAGGSPYGGELKFHDIDFDDAVVANTGAIANAGSVVLIGQGVTESTRIGRKCTIRSIGWRYSYGLPEQDAVATPQAGDLLRVIMYVDKQTNGATAGVTDILETADYQSFNNLANKGRFRILCDKVHTINYSGLASDGAGVVSQARPVYSGRFFKKMNLPLEFSGTAAPAAITEVRTNNIGILLISQGGVCDFASKLRFRFSDS